MDAISAVLALSMSFSISTHNFSISYPLVSAQVSADAPDLMSAEEEEDAKYNKQRLLELLLSNRIEELIKEAKDIPNLGMRTENGTYRVIMNIAAALNELELVKWLHENCGDCDLQYSGDSVIHDLGRNVGDAWQSMNFETFKYVYENGGGTAYKKANPERSLFVHVANHWIPEGDGGYGDYVINDNDIQFEQERRKNKFEMLVFLIENGHNVNEIDDVSESTAMFNAVDAHDNELVDFLIANGTKNNVGRNPLAAVTGRVEPDFLMKLLEFGYDPNEVTPYYYASPTSRTLLGRIVEGVKFKPELLEILETYNVDFNLRDTHGKTPIDYAHLEFNQENQPYTQYLLDKGAKLTDQYYYSALMHSIKQKDLQTLETLLTDHPHLADGLKDDEKFYPLERAVRVGNTEGFKLLLDAGANLNRKEYYSTEIFISAMSRKNYDLAQVILENLPTLPMNIPVEIDGEKLLVSLALKHASSDGNLEWVNKIISLGAAVGVDDYHASPIVGPAFNGHFDVVKALLDAGSPKNPTTNDGISLFKRLKEYESTEMLNYLKSYKP